MTTSVIDAINEFLDTYEKATAAGACIDDAPSQPELVTRVWLLLSTSRHHAIKGILTTGEPELGGYVTVDESIINQNAYLNNGNVLEAYFKQRHEFPIGKGDIWALVEFT